MYIPAINAETDRERIVAFMKQFSFATIITVKDNLPTATHLPFLVADQQDRIVLTSHFAKANRHWADLENNPVLVVFSEPHAYISPQHYDKPLNVPTWNYMSVHAYGKGQLVLETGRAFEVLEATIDNYEAAYKQQWQSLPDDYKLKMSKGIVAFEVVVTDLQAKKKLSQNKTAGERQRIIDALAGSNDSNERLIAGYMREQPDPGS